MTLKILLVDDNRTFLTSVKKVLAMLSNTKVIAEAHDGVEALALAQRLQPDLILLDIAMPGMNGLDVGKTMLTWPQPPRILFLSMHDSDDYREIASAMGALGLVGKANFVAELLPIITSLATSRTEAAS